MEGNTLVTRFTKNPAFAALVDQSAADLRSRWIAGGRAARLVDDVAAHVPATDGLSRATVKKEADTLRAAIRGSAAAKK